MSTYQHVLLAIDYSAENRHVAQKAFEIAKQNQAKLSIVHVIQLLSNNNTKLIDNLLDAEQNSLAKIANDLGIEEDDQWLRAGLPAREIVDLAKEQAVDLIVMGAHHHHGFANLFDSSPCKTLKRASCDVLAVHLN